MKRIYFPYQHFGGHFSPVKHLQILILLSLFLVSCTQETPSVVNTVPPAPVRTPTATLSPIHTVKNTSTSSPTAMSKCTETSGRMVEEAYPGVVVEGELPVLIYLPPCYDKGKDSYPVMYLLHGYPFDETHWGGLGIVEIVEAGWANGSWEPFIIIMPRIPDPLNTHSDGGPGSYEQEMLEGLIPYMESTYRVNRTGEYRALVGVSRGGVWALEIGFRNSDLFDTVAALSPALHVNNPRPPYDPFLLVRSVENLPANIFLSAAEDEGGFRTKTEELVSIMQELGIPHMYLLSPGIHEDATWMAIMEDLVSFTTMSWDDPL